MSGADFDADSLSPMMPRKGDFHNLYLYLPLAVQLAAIFVPVTELYTFLSLLAMVATAYYCTQQDRAMLFKAGYDAPAHIWWLLMPVYIWKRETITKTGHWTCVRYTVIYLLLMVVGWQYTIHTDSLAVAESACNVVTKLSVENDGVDAPICLRVVLESEVTTNNWKAIATMDNGTTRHLGVSFDPKSNDVSIKLSNYTGYFN